MTRLWKVCGQALSRVAPEPLEYESHLEDWLEADIEMLGSDLMMIGRQVNTEMGRLDLLAIDSQGSITIVELKRHKTGRDIVSQVLDYASWAVKLGSSDITRIANDYHQRRSRKTFSEMFIEKFGVSPPEPLNMSHNSLNNTQ